MRILSILYSSCFILLASLFNPSSVIQQSPLPDVLPIDGGERPIRHPVVRTRTAEQAYVETLLEQGCDLPADSNLVLFFARQFLGKPYVAKTLDQTPDREELVVNLNGMDCTTFVEYVMALALTARERGTTYEHFAYQLSHLRYQVGRVDYAKRNHYFSTWIMTNESPNKLKEVCGDANDKRGAYYPFVNKQVLKINYMTTHQSQYPQLKAHPELVDEIRYMEEFLTGLTPRYIPKRLLGRSKKDLGIQDGDILAIVTNKPGLDISHLGFAVWGNDGKLHLLNASQIHKRVVLEPKTLYQYMQEHSSQIGVRVIRMTD